VTGSGSLRKQVKTLADEQILPDRLKSKGLMNAKNFEVTKLGEACDSIANAWANGQVFRAT
jgi:hypothetical protein